MSRRLQAVSRPVDSLEAARPVSFQVAVSPSISGCIIPP
jgi:hypothetical protein